MFACPARPLLAAFKQVFWMRSVENCWYGWLLLGRRSGDEAPPGTWYKLPPPGWFSGTVFYTPREKCRHRPNYRQRDLDEVFHKIRNYEITLIILVY